MHLNGKQYMTSRVKMNGTNGAVISIFVHVHIVRSAARTKQHVRINMIRNRKVKKQKQKRQSSGGAADSSFASSTKMICSFSDGVRLTTVAAKAGRKRFRPPL